MNCNALARVHTKQTKHYILHRPNKLNFSINEFFNPLNASTLISGAGGIIFRDTLLSLLGNTALVAEDCCNLLKAPPV